MSKSPADSVIVGQGEFRYAASADWPQLPDGWTFIEATSVAADADGHVFVFNRGEHPLIVFDGDGKVIHHWGEGRFVRPHGVTASEDECVWLTDDSGHAIHKFTRGGRHLLTLGNGSPSDTGAIGNDYRTIRRAGPPFNYPTNVALGPGGDLFIADGYGNARIHRFSPDGRLRNTWGEPGAGPGQFQVPHGIAVDRRGIVYVADRENSRIQRFDPDGRFLDEWRDMARPCQVFIAADGLVYVAELGYRAGMWPGTQPPSADATGGRVSIFDDGGKLLARWGGGNDPCSPGDFFAPHDITVDASGNIYVAEVTWSAGGKRGLVPADCPSLRKFVRLREHP